MTRILVTGASGYIGSRLCAFAGEQGFDVVALGNAPLGQAAIARIDWRLGRDLPTSAFEGAAAVIHLAHSWSSDAATTNPSGSLNFTGSEQLARQTLAAGVPKFVFASTVSSRLQALNAYGRGKNIIEGRLSELPDARNRLVIARIGLVYGGPESGLYGLLSKLTDLPILLMIGLDRKVQPIHVDEVARGLVSLATQALPQPGDVAINTFILAAAAPISFADWLRELRRARTGKPLRLVPIPTWLALLGCNLTGFIPFLPSIDRERVLGLAGTAPMESAGSLAALRLVLAPPNERLGQLPSSRRRCLAEARAMLCYVAGQRHVPARAVVRLVRGVWRHDRQPLGLPSLVLKCPPLLRLIDPVRASSRNRLGDRLHLAVMVIESSGMRSRPMRLPRLLVQGLLEAAALPFRFLFRRRYR